MKTFKKHLTTLFTAKNKAMVGLIITTVLI